MLPHLRVRTVATALTASLLAAGCATDNDTGTDVETTASETSAQRNVSVAILEPEHLLTLDSVEQSGLSVLRTLYTPLVGETLPSGETGPGIAETVETDDGGSTWTITLEPGWTFHNGEPVTADSVVAAWNAGAYGPNGHLTNAYFSDIVGYEQMQAADDGDEPEADTLAGVRQVDELTLEVELTEPRGAFAHQLSHPLFSPLPDVYFDDPDAFREQPVGTGPFQMVEPWEHDSEIHVETVEDWAGGELPTIAGVDFRIYTQPDTAALDLLDGGLDIVTFVPEHHLERVRDALGDDRVQLTATSAVTYLAFPMHSETWGGDDQRDLRAALSLALDQEAIMEALNPGTRTAAHNLLAPPIPGYEPEVCDAWGTDPERAQELYEQAGPVDETLVVWFNEGGEQDEWIEAAANQWRDVLGIDAVEFRSAQPPEYVGVLTSDEGAPGPFRMGWTMDYPHPQNYLEPMLASWQRVDEGGSNFSRYASDDYDEQLRGALSHAELDDAALADFQDAVRIACEDVPVIPIYYTTAATAWGEDIDGVEVGPMSTIDFTNLRLR